MKKRSPKEHDFFSLFNRFVRDSRVGRRLQPNGKRLAEASVNNYRNTLRLLQNFSEYRGFTLRIRVERSLTAREAVAEKNYWKRFHRAFTNYLHNDCGHFDNYVGATFKIVKTFFNYLNKDLALGVGQFHKQFYVRKEDIAIFPLMPEELNYLIYDHAFEQSLCPRLQKVKDLFVFGCTVALRFSDLMALRPFSVREVNGRNYLTVRSRKSGTDTVINLPDYALEIIARYRKQKGRLLPHFNRTNLNLYIKMLLEQAGFTQPVVVYREKKGKRIVIKRKDKAPRFCDVATCHTMRRTGITTMLSLGMPEGVVRKISGHAPGSKEFYRYVVWSQMYMEQESQKMFEQLKEKRLQVA